MVLVQWLLILAVLLFGAGVQAGYQAAFMRAAQLCNRDVRAWRLKVRRVEALKWNLIFAAAVLVSCALSLVIWLS